MAQGDITQFNEFAESIGDGRIDLDTHTIKGGLTTLQVGGTPTIAATDPIPTWGAGGSTNLAASEVTPGGGYVAGGVSFTGVTWAQSSGVATFDANDISWTSAGSGDPATIKSLVVYSDTATNKDAIGFMDMTSDGTTAISLLAGDINVTWNVSGLMTHTVNV